MRWWLKRIAVCLLVVLFVLVQAGPASALGSDENQVTLVVIPGLSWEVMSPEVTPNLYRMMESGGAANMTLPLGGNDVSGYLAIGAGSRETANPGALSSLITASGGRVAIIGNSDLGTEAYRPAGMIIIDRDVQIAGGNVNRKFVHKDDTYLFGIRTDYDQLYKEYQNLRERTNFLVVETGDLTRLAAKRNEMASVIFKDQYVQRLAEADRFIGKLLNDTDMKNLLIVASPVSFADVGIGHKSSGVLLMDGGGVESNSLLGSNTTRQEGLVTIYDIAPTVLSHLGLPTQMKGGIGQVIGSIPSATPSNIYLMNQIENLLIVNKYRPFLVKGYVSIMIGLIAIAMVFRLSGIRKHPWLDHMLVGLLVMPAVYLILPARGMSSPSEMIMRLILLVVVAWTGLAFLKTVYRRLLVISSVTLGLVILDMLQQGRWMKYSVMGYDLLGGARYYGIGNEYMGMLIGASLLLYLIIQKRYPNRSKHVRIFAAITFAFITYLLAAPQFGTNAGGALAAVITYLYVLLSGADKPIFRKKWVWVLGGTLLALVGMLVLHTSIPASEQTHIGRAASLLLQGEFSEVARIIGRKWALNWWLLDVSVWGKLFWAVLLILIIDLLRPNFFRTSMEGKTGTSLAPSFLVGGIAVFLLNDSGVLAAAGLMLYAAVGTLTQALADELTVTEALIQDVLAEERTS